jgi:hypothetical protein
MHSTKYRPRSHSYAHAIEHTKSQMDLEWVGGALEGFCTALQLCARLRVTPNTLLETCVFHVTSDPNSDSGLSSTVSSPAHVSSTVSQLLAVSPSEIINAIRDKYAEAIGWYARRKDAAIVLQVEAMLRFSAFYLALSKRRPVTSYPFPYLTSSNTATLLGSAFVADAPTAHYSALESANILLHDTFEISVALPLPSRVCGPRAERVCSRVAIHIHQCCASTGCDRWCHCFEIFGNGLEA